MNDMSAPRVSDIDPVMTEIVRQGLVAITEEMKINLMRTAYNVVIYEALDFTVGLFDATGDTISIGIGLPMFIRGMSDTAKAKLEHYGIDGLKPGDVLLTNDAYTTGSHLNHMTFTVPIFYEGELVGFSGCMAHWQDVGGVLNGITTDIYSEGIQVPIVKMYREGQINDDILQMIRMNVRLPERAMGDLRAQIAAVKTGERRFIEMMDKYGRDVVKKTIAAIMDQSEQAARERVRQIPDGIYEAESFMDDDGVDVGKHIPIRVKVQVSGDEMTIDMSDVSRQVKGFYNSGEAAGRSCAQVAFKCLTAGSDLPINDGCFRPLKIILPAGKVVSATRPAAMRQWMTYPMTVIDTIFKALAPAIPDKVAAGHHADLLSTHVSGYRPTDGSLFLATTGLLGGGWGAKHFEDGMSATVCINDGDTHNGPCEQAENKFPILVESYGLRRDSGGAGRYRGGLGAERVVRPLTDVVINVRADRVHCRPWGLFGGLSAMGNQVATQADGTPEKVFPNGKVMAQPIKVGSTYKIRSGGGGGFGSPLERSIADVQNDVRQEYVSVDAARELYGVIIDPVTLQANEDASRQLRAEMVDQGLPSDTRLLDLYAPRASPALGEWAREEQPRSSMRAEDTDRELVAAVTRVRSCC